MFPVLVACAYAVLKSVLDIAVDVTTRLIVRDKIPIKIILVYNVPFMLLPMVNEVFKELVHKQ